VAGGRPIDTGADRAGDRDRSDLLAISVLIAIPTIIFAGADLLGGHLLLNGDNLLQNYPLRVLVGTDLRHGILPFWDPFIWSGTPLLAGLNAGAFYPTTLLFAIVPAHAAWIMGQIFVFGSIGVGTFVLFRAGGTSTLASFLGAISFTFAGAVASQTATHIDMGDGIASLPWALLAIRRIGEDSRWRWVLLLIGAGTFTILSGSPEAALDGGALCAAYALFRCLARRGDWRRYVVRLAVAGIAALGATAFVWIPALHFIANSQRPSGGESFASGFSFPASSGVLGLIPYLDGGYSLFSQPGYFGQSNFEEVVCYVGVLPLIATLMLLLPTWRRSLPRGEIWLWYGVLAVGIVLATAAGSPLEHLLYHVPLYGQQRNSGRNIIDADLAVCALFAWWFDKTRSRSTKAERRVWPERIIAFAPMGLVGIVGIWFLVSPTNLWNFLRASPPASVFSSGSGAAIVLAVCITGVAGFLVLFRSRIGGAQWRREAAVFVLTDIALFSLGSGYLSSEQPPEGAHQGPVLALVRANLSSGGRYAVYDPDLLDANQFVTAGEPDVGILDGLPSFSGYGAVVDSRYADETESQTRGLLNVGSLGNGSFEQLGLQVLVTVPESFLVPITALPINGAQVRVLSEQPGVDGVLKGGNSPPPRPPLLILGNSPARDLATDAVSSWWFGTTLSLGQIAVDMQNPVPGQKVQIGVLSLDGSVKWTATSTVGTDGSVVADLGDVSGTGIAVRTAGPALHSVQVAVTTDQDRAYLVSGVLADAVTPDLWTQVGSADDFTVFKASYSPSQTWLEPSGSEGSVPFPPDGDDSQLGTANVVSRSNQTTTIEAHSSRPSLLVWSTAWDSGWHADVVRAGSDRPLRVERVGLAQGVEIPAGTSLIRFSYVPPGFAHAVLISLGTLAAAVLIVISVAFFRRRRQRTAVAGGPTP
jgi:hypothetical protein